MNWMAMKEIDGYVYWHSQGDNKPVNNSVITHGTFI